MRKTTGFNFRAAVGTAIAFGLASSMASPALFGADEIQFGIDGGRVTLVATDAPLADVLAEWARVGDTHFVGAEPIGGERITLHLTNAPEADAIRLVLRAAAGYVAAPRRAGNPGSSRYDRVTILATRSTQAGTRAPAPALAPRSDADANTAGPDATGLGAAASPGLLPMEDLQRLLDATAGRTASPPPQPAVPDITVLTTPFPGIGAAGDLPLATDRRD